MSKYLPPLTALLLMFIAALGPRVGRAQVPFDPSNPNANNPAVPRTVRPDTARVRKPTAADKRKKAADDSVRRTEKLFGFRVTRPAKAGYLALVPGLGQVYNRRWWKLPIVYGGVGTVVGILVFEQRGLNEYSKASKVLLGDPDNKVPPDPTAIGNIGKLGPRAGKERTPDAIQNGIVFYRHYRDAFILYTGVAYGIQILDAIVDAHLHSFDVSDDLTLRWQPTLLPVPGPAVGLHLSPGVVVALHFK